MRVIWSSSSQLSSQRRLIHCFIFVSERCTQLMGFHTFTCAQPHARLTQQIFFLTALHRRIIWSSSQLSVRRRPTQRSSSVSDRNHTPNSGALSQVCVLEDVSRSCNHQQRCKEYAISLNPKKSIFGVDKGKLLGHIIPKDGILIDPSKIKTIKKIPLLKDRKSIQSFFG
jgi:hypothetical protein